MTQRWSETAEGRLVIRQPIGLAARLFGLPFLGGGLFFGYYLLLSFLFLVTGRVEFDGENLLGFVVLVFMAALFGTPGIVLCAFRKYTIIDPAAGEIVDLKDLFLFKRQTRRNVAEVAAVEVGIDVSRPSGALHQRSNQQTYYRPSVHVVFKSGERLLIGLFSEGETGADALAHTLASRLGVEARTVGEEPSDV